MARDQTKIVEIDTAAPRKPGRGSRRREEIADIALELFARNGFDGTSIRDIADAAGLTKPALYYHFQDKEALFEHVLVHRMSKLIESVRAAIEGTDDPLERIRRYLGEHSGRMDRQRDQFLMSRQSFLAISEPTRRQKVTELRDEFEQILRDLLSAAIDSGALQPTADPKLVARMLLSSVNDIPRWLNPDGGLKARDVALAYVDVTLKGMGAKT